MTNRANEEENKDWGQIKMATMKKSAKAVLIVKQPRKLTTILQPHTQFKPPK